MNTRKNIFLIIIGVILLIIIIFLMIFKENKNTVIKKENGNFNIWIVGDSSKSFNEFISNYKLKNKSMSNVEFSITSFNNYEDYTLALKSAFIKNQSPDIFVLNNNETSIFEDKIYALSNIKIDIHKFRQDYKGIFIDDLILSEGEGEEKKEYLKGIPVGYETLGIFYNGRFRLKKSDFNNLSSLNSAILKLKKFDIIPIAIGNGTTILNSGDILAQQFLLNNVKSIKNIEGNKLKQTLSEYMEYGDINGNNSYNSLFENAITYGKNNIDLFVGKEIGAIVAYPRIINELHISGFLPRFLYASPFPHSFSNDGPSLANYNYFVINNDSEKKNIALNLIKYLNTKEGAEEFLKKYKYYLPARRDLEDKLGDKNISNFYPNIQLKDFYSDEPLSSFDKLNKVIYDKEVVDVLDNFNTYVGSFQELATKLKCKSNIILELKNLSTSCK